MFSVTGEVDLTYLRRCRHSQTAGVTGQPAAAGQQQFLPEVCAVCSVSLYTNEMGAIGGHFGAFYKLFFLPFVTPPAHTLLRPLLSPTSSDETLERSQNSPPKRVLMGWCPCILMARFLFCILSFFGCDAEEKIDAAQTNHSERALYRFSISLMSESQ